MKTNYFRNRKAVGKILCFGDNQIIKLKGIEVDPGQKLSYQYHHKRQEQWTVIEGDVTVVLDNKKIKLVYGESIVLGVKYRIMNLSDKLVVFIEVQTGTLGRMIL
jgi:mannose-6-phosphate isomerase